MRVIRDRISREEGVAAVEFAIILPLLCLILFGVLEFGRVWSQYQLYQGAAREGARCAAVKATEFSDCDIEDEVHQAAAPYDVNDPIAVNIVGVGAAPNGCTDATRGEDVAVSWDQPLQVDIPFWNNLTVNSNIEAVFRCE
ncbi:MAG: TadE/TadG family type IV pilus assembly protein [Actinomycetota bacterium]